MSTNLNMWSKKWCRQNKRSMAISCLFFIINFVLSFKRIKWSQKAAYIPALDSSGIYIEKSVIHCPEMFSMIQVMHV